MLNAGDAVVLPQPRNPIPHLWILLTSPDPDGCAVVVNLTSLRPGADQSVKLSSNDHPYIHKPSVISFADARIANVVLLEKKIAEVGGHRERACSPQLLERIRSGALSSPNTPRKIKHYLQRALC